MGMTATNAGNRMERVDREEGAPAPGLPRERLALLCVDMVESVRLMQAHEDAVIELWQSFVLEVHREVFVAQGGQLVKSLGDGLLASFGSPAGAVRAAFELQRRMARRQAGLPAGCDVRLRVGLHAADVVRTDFDLLGRGVNLVARLTAAAGPGETVASEDLRASLVGGLDADWEDLGEVYLKHLDQPVRLYRLERAQGDAAALPPDRTALQPTLLVAPLAPLRPGDPQAALHGELVADALATALGRGGALRVLSPLSARRLRGRGADALAVGAHMGAGYLCSGECQVRGERLQLHLRLTEVATGQSVWQGGGQGAVAELFDAEGPLLPRLAGALRAALVQREVHHAVERPLPNLHSATLLLGAVELMHRQSRWAFEHAGQLLAHLTERHPRHAQPAAWRAKWHVIGVAQGWSGQPAEEAARALQLSDTALALEPASALAWSIRANARAYIRHDHDAALADCLRAISVHPSEPLAWLYLGVISGWRGDAARAREGAAQALSLSPQDPMGYYFDVLAAAALLGAGDDAESVRLARRSLRANREHLPTHKVLAIGLALNGQTDEARQVVQGLRLREPGFSVATFRERSPWGRSPRGDTLCEALAAAGVPRH